MRLLVDDFARSWGFYRDVLGLTPVPGHGEPPYGEFRAPGVALLSIFERSRMAEAIGTSLLPARRDLPGNALIVFETKDVDEFARYLQRRQVTIQTGPADRPEWRIRTLHFQDPDGNLIEVYSEHPVSRSD